MTRVIGWPIVWLRQGLVILVLLVLAWFTYVHFFQVPYAGFDFSNGQITYVFVPTSDGSLQVGDQLIQVGDVTWADFAADVWQTFFNDVEPGQTVPIQVQRNGETLLVPWLFPGFTQAEFLSRLYGIWWLCYAFWFAGAFTYLFIRPKDTQWLLLIAFNFLTALWLAVGSGPSHWHTGGSALILKVTIWLCLPVYWHLHWNFPTPLKNLPAALLWIIYALGIGLAFSELFQWLPPHLHLMGFLLAIGGSLVLLVTHVLVQPEQWASIRLLLNILVLVISPIIVVGILGIFGGDLRFITLALLGLPLIPGAYIYAIYRHQFGRLEVRANRLLTLYLYLLILSLVVFIVSVALSRLFALSSTSILVGLAAAISAALVTTGKFAAFERFVERRILGIALPPASLLESYASQIATKLDEAGLVQLLQDQVLPSLLVRQSAIIYWGSNYPITTLLMLGVDKTELPSAADLPALLAQAGVYRPPTIAGKRPAPCPWGRLILPLNLSNNFTGLWLLGRRDPDDVYAQKEIPTLQALAAQTAVALTNILQAENLHKLYQANIDRNERERNHLALELHDSILNQLALLAIYVDEDSVAPQFFQVFEELTTQFRQTIRGLRPAMLNYGLQAALDELADQLAERVAGKVDVQFQVASENTRYPLNVEQHIFRIVQQAAENALEHAAAGTLSISGDLNPAVIHLTVADDGVGFPAGEQLDFATLLANQHFGLVGMHERAALIGAEMTLDSVLNQGTRVTIRWCAEKQE